jgi:hypothetical protein
MTATITQVRDGIKARLATISGLETFARTPGAGVQPPLAVVYPAGGQFLRYGTAMDGSSDDAFFTIKLATGSIETEEAELALDAYLAHSGANSIFAAMEGGRTLGGIVSYARVTDASGYGPILIGSTQFHGAEILVSVAL